MVAPLLLAVLNIAPAVWQEIPSEYKQKIKAQVLKGNIGMAKIMLKQAKKAAKTAKLKRGKKR